MGNSINLTVCDPEEWELDHIEPDPSFWEPVIPQHEHLSNHNVAGRNPEPCDLNNNYPLNPNAMVSPREHLPNQNVAVRNQEPRDLNIHYPLNLSRAEAKANTSSITNDYSTKPKSLTLTLGNEKLHLDVVEKLGEGAFGSVSRAIDNRGVSFAIKSLYCHDQSTYDELVFHEIEILFKLKHPNIVTMYGFDFIHSTALLIMEYCGEGTLNERLNRPVESLVQLQWMEQLASALLYLHDSDIVHRDLKTDNILLSNNNVKIADFGLARHFVCCTEGRLFDNSEYIKHYSKRYMETLAGTPFWLAPEVFDNKYSELADIFSLGIIFHAICERQFCVFDGARYYGIFVMHEGEETGIGVVMHEIQEWVEPVFYCIQNWKLKEVICDMLQFDPDARVSLPTARDVINEAYLIALNAK